MKMLYNIKPGTIGGGAGFSVRQHFVNSGKIHNGRHLPEKLIKWTGKNWEIFNIFPALHFQGREGW